MTFKSFRESKTSGYRCALAGTKKVAESLCFELLYKARTKKGRRGIPGNSCMLTTQERAGAIH